MGNATQIVIEPSARTVPPLAVRGSGHHDATMQPDTMGAESAEIPSIHRDTNSDGGAGLSGAHSSATSRATPGALSSTTPSTLSSTPSDEHRNGNSKAGGSPPTGAVYGSMAGEDTFVFPASREQVRYWMLAQLDPESTASNMAISFEIEGKVVDRVAEDAIAALTLRHEALRTVFRLEAGVLSQVVLNRPLYRFTVEDLSHLAGPEQQDALEASVSRHGHTVIDLGHGPVLHAHLIHLHQQRHVMALTMNHIVCDGWSNGLLIRDFTILYEAALAGREPDLPELPFQFADFSLWQNEYLKSPAADEAAAFWKSHITADLSALDMPTDRPRPSGRSFPGHIESALLPKAIDDKLREYCRKTASTKHIVLLAAFEALCAQYTGQDEFLLGSTIANRTQPGMEDVVGRFANPQIIVAKVKGDPSFAQLEQRVRDWETAAYTHQDLPFSRIIEDFQIDQAGATSQFLQVWFLYQKAFMQPQAGTSVRVTPRRSVSGGVDFDLLVSVVERAEGPRIQFEYNTLIFEKARIRGLIDGFIQLLDAALAQPDVPLSQLLALSHPGHGAAASLPRDFAAGSVAGVERRADQDSLPGAAGTAAAEPDLLSTLARRVARSPFSVAVADGQPGRSRSLTWAELEKQSSAVAAAVLKRSAPAERTVPTIAVLLSPRVESVVALCAALKLGARIVALPSQSDRSATAEAILSMPGTLLLSTEGPGSQPLVAYESFAGLPEADLSAEAGWVGPHRPASFLFAASAKSDAEKEGHDTDRGMVMAGARWTEIAAAELLRSVEETAAALRLDAHDSMLTFTAVAALDAVLDLLVCMVSGAELHLAAPAQTGSIASRVAQAQASWIVATPSQAKALLASGWDGDRRVSLMVRGGRLPLPLASMLTLRLKSAVYLLTSQEGGGFTALRWLTGPRCGDGLLPLGGRSLVLTNAEGRILPNGAFGELCTKQGVRAGVPTGYMARSSSNGTIELADRSGRFVQLRGHRVCLGDIEDAAYALPFVHDAWAATQTERAGEADLCLYLVAGGKTVDARDLSAEVRQHLQKCLPSHLLPSEYYWLDALPYGGDGSLDFGLLPKTDPRVGPDKDAPADPAPTGFSVAAQAGHKNTVEEKLAAIWKDVLGLKSVDVHQSFFALGGSSLLLVRLFARINKAFDAALPITTIFDAQSIAQLAEMLGGEKRMSPLVHVQTGGTKPPLFMIHSYLLYQGLSLTLGADQPFYGLRELEEDGQLKIEERVQRYVAEIRRIQPEGPYHLAGWCAAGPLTVEVARELLRAGQKVAYLALFDSWLPGYLESVEARHARRTWVPFKTLASKLAYHWGRMRSLSWTRKAWYVWMAMGRNAKETRYRIYLRNWERLHRISQKYKISLPQFMHNTSFQTFSALKDYQGERLPVRITLVRASDSRVVTGAEWSCGWEQVAEGGVDVVWAPGDHETMFMGDQLKATAELVRQGLELAAARGDSATMPGAEEPQENHPVPGGIHVSCPTA